jgi:hypothetical protein
MNIKGLLLTMNTLFMNKTGILILLEINKPL